MAAEVGHPTAFKFSLCHDPFKASGRNTDSYRPARKKVRKKGEAIVVKSLPPVRSKRRPQTTPVSVKEIDGIICGSYNNTLVSSLSQRSMSPAPRSVQSRGQTRLAEKNARGVVGAVFSLAAVRTDRNMTKMRKW